MYGKKPAIKPKIISCTKYLSETQLQVHTVKWKENKCCNNQVIKYIYFIVTGLSNVIGRKILRISLPSASLTVSVSICKPLQRNIHTYGKSGYCRDLTLK